VASFDWIVENDLNWRKVIEGKYASRSIKTNAVQAVRADNTDENYKRKLAKHAVPHQ
jgi:hypothetical protein